MNTLVQGPARTGTTRLSDGRLLGWGEWGPTSGTPVLFCPGAAMSRWLGFGADVLEGLKVRLISLDRPGLGASTPAPGRGLLDWAEDVRGFAAAQGLERLPVVGYSQGAPFALACAAKGVVTGVALVAGGDELAYPALRGMLHPEVAKLVDLSAAEPARAEAFFAGMSVQMMWDMVIGMSSESDRAVFTAPRFAEAYRRALDEGFMQGSAGYARDTVLAMSRWPFDPGAIRVPVDLWYGGLDTSTVHSPDQGETLARRIPTARRQLLPQVGSALLWTHSEDILRSLLSRTG
ncbi:alpha/beta fold hydrolase [Hyalangium rubrum]|uniref:Alpha/beta hydrolase n=1 Tax=Hyalangium rubrum TaxID=3103134 RepID=A0ABU5HGA7_9BACT|nr:alpha/beta hydrolase [Hyalangium sp. s54d21]MDY7232489.1 alpha/beta hydrolase [Hyalangium sp. s54d21]